MTIAQFFPTTVAAPTPVHLDRVPKLRRENQATESRQRNPFKQLSFVECISFLGERLYQVRFPPPRPCMPAHVDTHHAEP
jgi:hypothetical protein